jgi:DNA-binding beta-propeller fold protein YncE
MRVGIRTTLALLLVLALAPLTAHAWDRRNVETFATLPAGERHPEGITADKRGNIYVTTFDIARAGTAGEVGHLFVFRNDGRLLRKVLVQNSSPLLLDLAFSPTDPRALLVIDFGGAKVLKVDSMTGASEVFATIPDDPSIPGAPGPNVLTFDDAGNVYISDSFQGAIWRTGPVGGIAGPGGKDAALWVVNALLRTTGVPGFGANGLAFNNAQTLLFVANTGNDTIVKIPVTPGPTGPVAGTPAVFVNSVNGADGLIIDKHDNLWVAANQSDEIVVINSSGRAIAKLGDFDGIDHAGRPKGLLFPASLVRHGDFLYITNLAIDLRAFDTPGAQTNGTIVSQWAAEVTLHTISRIRARVPRIDGLPKANDMDDDD